MSNENTNRLNGEYHTYNGQPTSSTLGDKFSNFESASSNFLDLVAKEKAQSCLREEGKRDTVTVNC